MADAAKASGSDAAAGSTLPATRSTRPGKVVRVRVPVRLPQPLQTALRSLGGASWPAQGLAASVLTPAVPGALGDTEELRDGFRQVAWAAACVNLRCVARALVRPRVWDRDPDEAGAQEVTDGEIVRLLQRPMPLLDAMRFGLHDMLNTSLYGESVHFLLDRNGDPVASVGVGPGALIDLPAEIVPVRGDLAALRYDERGEPIVWTVASTRATRRDWPLFAVVNHFEMPDPSRPWRGLGRMAQAWGPAAQMHVAERYQNHLLRNAGDPGGVITIDGVLGPDELERTREEVRDEWGGIEHAGEWHVLEGNAKVQATRHSAKDMEYPTLWKERKEDIGAVLGVPGALVGSKDLNFATYAGHWTQFTQLTIRTWLTLDEAAWNAHFFARLRDPQLRRYRLRYDTEVLAGLFASLQEQAESSTSMTAIGVPLDEALRQAGIKTDPIPGGDVPMVATGKLPLEAAIALGRAQAASALQLAGVDRAAALAEVGLGHLPVVEEPEVEEEDDAPGEDDAPPASDDDEDEGKAAAAPARRALPALRRAKTGVVAGGSAAERRAAWQQDEAARGKHIEKMRAGVNNVFRRMKAAQLRAFEQFAAEGRIDRTGTPAVVYRGPAPVIPTAAARELLAAWVGDRIEERAIARDPEQQRRLFARVATCCGTVERYVPFQPRQEAWRAAWPTLAAAAPLVRLREVAWLQRATLTEEQIDTLIVLLEARWAEALEAKVLPVTISAYTEFARDVSEALGVGMVDVTNPAWLAAMKTHAIQVVEGTQSVVAQRLRSDIIRVLADAESHASLQQLIAESMGELKATTTRAFKSHQARALAIARTEVGRAASTAKQDELLIAFREGVIAKKGWMTSGQPEEPEGPTRSSHFAIDGQEVPVDQPFTTGAGVKMDHPHDPKGPASEVVNCKCSEYGVLAE